MKRVAIIGGGITGLAAAVRLSKQPSVEVAIFESTNRLGGALQTDHVDGFLIERSADMFVTCPSAAVQFCRQIGIGDQLIEPNQTNRFSSIAFRGNLVRIPQGFALLAANKILPVLKSPLLGWDGKLRFLREWFCKPVSKTQDESLTSFATRHYGSQVFERLVQPLVAGIYSAEANQLSVQATLQRFVEMEQEYGSLIRAARIKNRNAKLEQQSSGARYGLFVAPQMGMQSIVNAAVEKMVANNVRINLNSQVTSLVQTSNGWELMSGNTSPPFDAILLATKASATAKLLAEIADPAVQLLNSIPYGSMIVAAVCCSNDSFRNGVPKGFGFVVPRTENQNLIACSFSSNKFPGRAADGRFLMRAFIGGSKVVDWLNRENQEIEALIETELGKWLNYSRRNDDQFKIFRWSNSLPQYHVGHLEKISNLKKQFENLNGIEIAGSSYHGVGIPACIQSGVDAAGRILQPLNLTVETE